MHQERVREILILNDRATLLQIQKALEEAPRDPISLTINYIAKLRKKIEGEQVNRFNHAIVHRELSKFQDLVSTMRVQLIKIASDKEASHKDKIAAMREITRAHSDVFQRMFDAGIFTKKIGEMELTANISAIIAEVNKGAPVTFKWQEDPNNNRNHIRERAARVVEGPKPAELIKEEHEGGETADSRGDHPEHSQSAA